MCGFFFPTEIAPETQREGRHHLSLIEGLRKEFKVSCDLRIKTERLFWQIRSVVDVNGKNSLQNSVVGVIFVSV